MKIDITKLSMHLSQLLLLVLVSGTAISSGVECVNDECSVALSSVAKSDADVEVYCKAYAEPDPILNVQARASYSDELSDFEQKCKNDAAAIASACACWSKATDVIEIPVEPKNHERGLPIRTWRQSWDSSCGKDKWITCKGSRWGDCCSPFGWCGRSPEHCGQGCQTECGLCSTKTSTTTPPKHTTTPYKSPTPTHSPTTASSTSTTSSPSTTSSTTTATLPVGSSLYLVKERFVPPMANALRHRDFEDPSIRRRGGMLRSPLENREEEKRKRK